MNKLKELYKQARKLNLGVDYQAPGWVLTRISDSQELRLDELTQEQRNILIDIQAEEFWPSADNE